MKLTTTFLAALMAVVVFSLGCTKSTNTTSNIPSNLYLAGNMDNGGLSYYPAYWNNGVATQLSSNFYGSGQSIYLSGNDVYVGGYIQKSLKYYPIIWKNSTSIFSSDTSGMIEYSCAPEA